MALGAIFPKRGVSSRQGSDKECWLFPDERSWMKPQNPTASFRSEKTCCCYRGFCPPYFLFPSIIIAPVFPKSMILTWGDQCVRRAGHCGYGDKAGRPQSCRRSLFGRKTGTFVTNQNKAQNAKIHMQGTSQGKGGGRASLGQRMEQETPLSKVFCPFLYHSPLLTGPETRRTPALLTGRWAPWAEAPCQTRINPSRLAQRSACRCVLKVARNTSELGKVGRVGRAGAARWGWALWRPGRKADVVLSRQQGAAGGSRESREWTKNVLYIILTAIQKAD